MTDNQTKAKEYLERIQKADETIIKMSREKEALEWKAAGLSGIQYDKDKIQASPQSYMETAIIDAAELGKQIDEAKLKIDREKGIAYSIIKTLENEDHKTILEWFYLNGLPMYAVAEHMMIAERTAYYWHEDALETFGNALKERCIE